MIHSARLADIIIHNYAVDEMKLMKKEKKTKKWCLLICIRKFFEIVSFRFELKIILFHFISLWSGGLRSASIHID